MAIGLVFLAFLLANFQWFAAREWALPGNRPLALDRWGPLFEFAIATLGLFAVAGNIASLVLAFFRIEWYFVIAHVIVATSLARLLIRMIPHFGAIISSVIGVPLIDAGIVAVATGLWFA